MKKPIFKYNPGIFLEGLRKTTKIMREQPGSGLRSEHGTCKMIVFKMFIKPLVKAQCLANFQTTLRKVRSETSTVSHELEDISFHCQCQVLQAEHMFVNESSLILAIFQRR